MTWQVTVKSDANFVVYLSGGSTVEVTVTWQMTITCDTDFVLCYQVAI